MSKLRNIYNQNDIFNVYTLSNIDKLFKEKNNKIVDIYIYKFWVIKK